MPRLLILLLSFGCSDYEVSRIQKAEEKSWFEETSDQYQDGFDPDTRPEDDEDDATPAERNASIDARTLQALHGDATHEPSSNA